MKVKTEVVVGNTRYSFEVDEGDDKKTLHKAVTLGNPPRYCNVCKNSTLFSMEANKDKEDNIYINMKCLAKDCYSKAKLGSFKSGGFFWHKYEKYEPKKEESLDEELTVDMPA